MAAVSAQGSRHWVLLRRMGQKIALLVNRAALDRHVVPQAGERRFEAFATIDDDEIRSGEPAAGQAIQHGAPSGLAFAAHVLDGEHHLLAVAADAERDQQRDASSASRPSWIEAGFGV